MQKPIFSKEEIYDAKIAPLIDQIIAICKDEEIPLITGVCYESTDTETMIVACHIPAPGGWTPDEFHAFSQKAAP